MSTPPIGRRFVKGNPGRPRVVRLRREVGIAAAKALESGAWDVVEKLLKDRSGRVRLETAKVILGYAIGLPKATLEVQGGVGNLAAELSAALAEARARRAALDTPTPVLAIEAAPDAGPDDGGSAETITSTEPA